MRLPPAGIYAIPVTPRFHVSHQWLEWFSRRGLRIVVGVYFRIPDDETVWVGDWPPYNHQAMAASEAVAVFMAAEDRLGWEVVIPRPIAAREIHRIKRLTHVPGRRFSQRVKARRSSTCDSCTDE